MANPAVENIISDIQIAPSFHQTVVLCLSLSSSARCPVSFELNQPIVLIYPEQIDQLFSFHAVNRFW